MNTIIEKINTIIENFDKAYGEWMDKEDRSLEDVMQIFKKYNLEFEDLYDLEEIKDDSVEEKVLLKILGWINFTVGEIYLECGTETQDFYDPKLELKSIVEKFVQS